MQVNATVKAERLLSIKQAIEQGIYINESGLRWLVFNKLTNGYASAFLKVGRRVLVDPDEFIRITKQKNGIEARDAA
ncbi:MAG: hypothetical protein P9L92_18190 [Candidatus Electryonea clarkiae]|nr:hypothetical protein [Candidatus Electryonea clarkiae]